MSLVKDERVGDQRRRDRPDALEAAASPPTLKKHPNPLSASELLDRATSPELSHVTPFAAPGSPLSNSSAPPNVPSLSPRIHVRTSSLGYGNKSPESPKHVGSFTGRKPLASIKHERRESLLGRFGGTPPGSPMVGQGLSSSVREHSGLANVQQLLELDTDSDEDSAFPPPISFTEQVSHLKHVNPTVRLRQNGSVPVNSSTARKMLTGMRERRFAQERSQNVPTTPTGRQAQEPVSQVPPPSESPVDKSGAHTLYRLERGGVVVATSAGSIQFGIPPETIKDTLSLGIEVPQVFVVPRDRFDTVAGLNMCEVEFPGYYQFFIRQKSLTLVASAEAEKSIRQLMHEILQGPPEAHLYTNEECLTDYDSRPDHVKEMEYFVRPRNGRSINVGSLFSFIRFEPFAAPSIDFFLETAKEPKEGGEFDVVVAKAKVYDCIEIHETTKEWIVYDRGLEIARVEFWMASTVPPRFPLAMVPPSRTFVPPVLGVTVLGSSHGFDSKQSTSGFVLWMHGRGIMVDPPPNATDLLKRGGISPRWISAIILTHCHADHDAGTFQKILVEGRVTLMTTKTIMASFLRKYSKISGFTEAFLCRLFEPRVVKIGEEVFYAGGIIRFFYSLHALPCIGFQAFVAEKSIAYSADTFYDPSALHQLCEEGVLSEGRREALLHFPFETADVVIHEAGIPPIHTPVDILKQLSDEARARLYVIHIAEAAAETSGLRLARAGTENTIRVADGDAYALSLDVLTNSELFFPFLASANKFGRNIVSAAQERMPLMDYDNPSPLDFSFLDCTSQHGAKRFDTSSAPVGHGRDRGSSMLPRASNLADRPPSVTNTRDSDLSLSSVKRNSAGFEGIGQSKNLVAGRRTSASTNKSLAFSSDADEEDFTVPQVADLLRLSYRRQHSANELVSAEEGEGDKGLYLIMKGFCRVERTRSATDLTIDEDQVQPAEGPPGTILEPGDCFGLFVVSANRANTLVRKCVIRTLTEVELMEFNMSALWYLLNVYPALDRRLSRMHELRALEAWRTMELNSCLRRLASFQRTQLNAVLELKEFKKGEELWTKKAGPRNAYLVAEGQLIFPEVSENERPFEAGAFLCDFHSMIQNRRPSSTSSMSATAVQQNQHLVVPSSMLSAHAVGSVIFPPGSDVGSTETSHNSSAQSLTSGEIDHQHLTFPSVTLLAKTDCRLYQINWRDAFLFLESNPGVLVQIYHSYVVE